jgi:hypothetical protein
MRTLTPHLLGFGLALTALFVLAGPALADDAMKVAIEADSVNQEFCIDIYNKEGTMGSGMIKVAEVWRDLDESYTANEVGYLLYWRGALGQCLGSIDSAKTDLAAFIKSQGNSTMFATLVRDAQKRLRRLGMKSQSTGGPAAELLRQDSALELRVRYAGGSGLHSLGCTDSVDSEDGSVQHLNSACRGNLLSSEGEEDRGGGSVNDQRAPAASILGLDVELAGYPAKGVGVSGRLLLDYALPSGLPDDRSPGLSGQVLVGPIFRFFLDSAADGGLAKSVRVHPVLSLAFGEISPWVGNAKYAASQGYLDGGRYSAIHIGGGLGLSGNVETGAKSVLDWAVDGSVSALATGTLLREVASADASVLRSPAPLSSSRFGAGGHVGVLFASSRAPLALGPFVDFRFHQMGLAFPNDPADCWDADPSEDNPTALCLEGDEYQRKVYSTARTDFLIRAGIQILFGAPRK